MAKKGKKKSGSTAGKILWRVLFVLALCVLVFSVYNLIQIFLSYKEGTDEYDELRQYTAAVTPAAEQPQTDDSSSVEEQPAQPPLTVDFASLQAINPDVKGWLYIETLDISYPIVQGADNDEYLHTTYEGNSNYAGSIFVDYQNSGDFSDCNTIVYGHNMKNQSMFGKLKLLKEWEEYKNSMYFWILTPEHDYRYEIFSVQYTDASSDVYTLFSEPGTLFVDYLETMQSQSEIPVEERTFTAEDKVVTLSTCSSSNGDGRFVVQGVQVPY